MSVNRLDDRPGIYVTSCDEILYLPDDRSAPRARIPLNRLPGSRSGNRRAKRLRGCADELLAIPGHKKLAITVRNRKGKSVRKLAIVDLNSNSVEQVIISRRRLKLGEKVAKVILLSPLLLTPDPWLWVRAFAGDFINLSLTASPNGEFVYVLDNDADLGTVRGTVTIVRSEDSTVVTQVRLRAKGQKILFCARRAIRLRSDPESDHLDRPTDRQETRSPQSRKSGGAFSPTRRGEPPGPGANHEVSVSVRCPHRKAADEDRRLRRAATITDPKPRIQKRMSSAQVRTA